MPSRVIFSACISIAYWSWDILPMKTLYKKNFHMSMVQSVGIVLICQYHSSASTNVDVERT